MSSTVAPSLLPTPLGLLLLSPTSSPAITINFFIVVR
jgi:hypothetical protein